MSLMPIPTMHIKARGSHPSYPQRFEVPDDKVKWSVEWSEYKPVDFTHQNVIDNMSDKNPKGWANPEKPENQRTKNPIGRTGMKGRGLLGKWGANYAADPIFTRFENNKYQVALIKRKDTSELAIPGGMVDTEDASATLTAAREFLEEANNSTQETDQVRVQIAAKKLSEVMNRYGKPIYKGYVDDPRNTDHAWMETSAYNLHITDVPESIKDELTAKHKIDLKNLHGGDDAVHAKWYDWEIIKNTSIYASHKDMLIKTMEYLINRDNINASRGVPSNCLQRIDQMGGANENDIYYQKYIKYKIKYAQLKNKQ